MKKIIVLSSHTPSIFWFRMDMMKAFAERGYEVVAVGNESEAEWSQCFNAEGIRYRQIEVARNGTNPIKDLKTLKSIKRVFDEEKPDRVFSYQAKTVIYGGIAATLSKIDGVFPLIAGVGSVFLADGFKAGIVRIVLKTEYKIGMKKAEKVFFQNPDDVDVFVNNGIIRRDKAVMLHGSGVNLKRFTVMPMPEKPAFLCISRLIRDKGVSEYLEAARAVKKNYPDVRFLLVGPYDTNPSALKNEDIEPYVSEGIIEYFGEQTDVRPFLGQCSVFVLPSYREGTPKTVLEAMASGRAVITTDAPGCRETVRNGENGFLIPVCDVEALAEKMIYLIENPSISAEFGKCGRKMAEDVFDVDLVNNIICNTMKLNNGGLNHGTL